VLHSEEYQPHSVLTNGTQWLLTWGYVIAWSVVIFMLSAQSNLQLPDSFPPSSDKVAHFWLYGVLGWLWSRAIRSTYPRWTTVAVVLSALAFTGLYGLSDEWHQLYVPGRCADLSDALADVVAAPWAESLSSSGYGSEKRAGHESAKGSRVVPRPFDPAA